MSEAGAAPVSPTVVLSVDAAVAEIRFNRPQALNALNNDLANAFVAAVDAVCADATVRVVVLTGAGRAFMAGGDLGEIRTPARATRPHNALALLDSLNAAIVKLAQAPFPTIASVNGAAAGAGMSFAMMADLAIAADDATFNMAYLKVANNPDCGGSFALVRLVGLRRAMEIALFSETLDAATALRLGLVNRVVPAAELRETTLAMARRLAAGPAAAIAATKTLLRRSATAALPDQLAAEGESFARLTATADFEEGVDAFFGKRRAVFAQ